MMHDPGEIVLARCVLTPPAIRCDGIIAMKTHDPISVKRG